MRISEVASYFMKSCLSPFAGDDAKGVRWSDVSSTIKLYASHQDFIKKVADTQAAYW